MNNEHVATARPELMRGDVCSICLTDGKWTDGIFLFASKRAHWPNRQVRTRYTFRNARTGREVVVKSMAKIRKATPGQAELVRANEPYGRWN